eukprot:CAMPEP_0194026704 /NCGR_PEP_ID=MMETSP0009_2-20130614/1010_1 /TAXON_ID=210454 /ORGANISM="Grammatophora oceanica, Strain CCMP 410" /LENGTH=69 /DNA_ID=CAMNT_0038665547 /DNA_START=848 /DNA_END=1057 /DNA_ORIENTATION=-
MTKTRVELSKHNVPKVLLLCIPVATKNSSTRILYIKDGRELCRVTKPKESESVHARAWFECVGTQKWTD